MSSEAIVQKIISDAEAEAEAMIKDAEEKAASVIAAAEERARAAEEETRRECTERAKAIADGRAASARLEGAKIVLQEKRRVLDEIYLRAKKRLLALNERETIGFLSVLLQRYAEEGDEVVFAKDCAVVEKMLPLAQERKLKVSEERADIEGGFLLRGALSDRDVSYDAVLAADREEHQAEIAAKLFRN